LEAAGNLVGTWHCFSCHGLCFLYVNLEISTVGLLKRKGNSELKVLILKCSVLWSG